jgi:NADPH:quinone reductase-like Zn-dependent oxidoreductase
MHATMMSAEGGPEVLTWAEVPDPAGQVIPLPGHADAIAGAALPEALCTVYSNLVLDGGLSAGQAVVRGRL